MTTTGAAWKQAFEPLRWLGTADLDGVEPFGFADGISQPQIDWDAAAQPAPGAGRLQQCRRARRIPARLSQRVRASTPTGRWSTPMPRAPGCSPADRRAGEEGPRSKRHLSRHAPAAAGRAGLLAVHLRSKPAAIPRGAENARGGPGRPHEGGRSAGAASRSGPFPASDRSPKQVRQNQFTFDQDPAGVGCPFGAHVRRANPRNTDFPGRADRPRTPHRACWASAARAFGTI